MGGISLIKSEGQKSTQSIMKICKALQSASSEKAKERILKRNKNDQLLKMVLCFLLDSQIKTGITRSKLKKQVEEDVQGIVEGMNGRIIMLLTYLYENNTSNDFDIAVCQQFCERHDEETREFIITLITKTINLGLANKWRHF